MLHKADLAPFLMMECSFALSANEHSIMIRDMVLSRLSDTTAPSQIRQGKSRDSMSVSKYPPFERPGLGFCLDGSDRVPLSCTSGDHIARLEELSEYANVRFY